MSDIQTGTYQSNWLDSESLDGFDEENKMEIDDWRSSGELRRLRRWWAVSK